MPTFTQNTENQNESPDIQEKITPENNNPQQTTKKKKISIGKIISAIIIVASITLLSIGGYFAYKVLSTSNEVFVRDDGCQGILCNLPKPQDIFGTNQATKVKGQDEGRTNFLLIGLDNSAGLSDSIILASVYYKEKKIVTVNIPRDLWVQDGGCCQKINEVYQNGERLSKQPGAGARHLADFLSKEFEIPIHYWAVTNFDGVEKTVDQLGGIEVDVENSFTDCTFPTRNYSGYMRPCPSFTKGITKMNGATALIYARSRHSGNNGEGSDFARGKRQSIVIQNIIEKIKSQDLLGNINNINSFLGILGESVKTSLSDLGEIKSLYSVVKDINLKEDFLRVIWQTDNGFLCTGPNPEANYYITFCGGQVAGSRSVPSASRLKGKNSVQNSLVVAQSTELFDSKVSILGNNSEQTNIMYRQLENLGFNNLKINNKYSAQIKAGVKNVDENITVYIPNEKLRNLFNSLNLDKTVKFTLEKEIPSSRILPKGYEDPAILVWVENPK